MKKIFALLLIFLCLNGCTMSSYSGLVMDENSGDDYWNATYEKFNGYKERNITISGDGSHAFAVEIVTDSGSLGLTITDNAGNELYTGNELPTSAFEVGVDSSDKYQVRVDADDHSGSFKIEWE